MIEVAAEPYPFKLDPERTALVVIDMQRDFVEHGGFGAALGNDVTRLQAIIPAVAEIIALFRAKGWPILHTRECHRPDLSDCPPSKRLRGEGAGLRIGDTGAMGRLLVRGEPGAAIIPECAPLDGEMVVDKPGKGMFCNTDVEAMLHERGITHLVFTGVTTEVCVQTSMREANDRGFECLLMTDCTESYFAAYKAAVISMVTAQGGIVGWATDLAALSSAVK
ncbi:MAG: cysteine hydrolase [Hyphomicrobiales bacterium]|nr:cysteine hydrolase [Hyphomicrobiales bacterium]